MAEFLTTSGTSYNIEKIITEAKKNLFLISPYLQLSKTLFERLKDASLKRVQITIVYGKDELKPNERNSLAELSSLQLYFFENLHAKCYFNEDSMVITSMNMYEFSEKNNREMGVLISRLNDQTLYEKAFEEAKSIIQSSEAIRLSKADRYFSKDNSIIKNEVGKHIKLPTRGYCIRCESRIGYAPGKPYCRECYLVWANFENPEYKETCCHGCGEFIPSTMNKPLCYRCYSSFGAV